MRSETVRFEEFPFVSGEKEDLGNEAVRRGRGALRRVSPVGVQTTARKSLLPSHRLSAVLVRTVFPSGASGFGKAVRESSPPD